jgi:hypothetical protein
MITAINVTLIPSTCTIANSSTNQQASHVEVRRGNAAGLAMAAGP